MDLEFKEATSDDLEELIALLSDDALGAKREDLSRPLNDAYCKAFDAINRDPNNLLLTVTLDSQIVGMLQLTFIPYLTHIGS